MKKSGLFIANIVLACVFFVFLIVSVVITFAIKGTFALTESVYKDIDWQEELYGSDYYEEDFYRDYERDVYELPMLENARVEFVGAEFQGETAYEGYQYYLVTATIYNGGTDYLITEYLDLDVEGIGEDDVYNSYIDLYEETWDSDFSYSMMDIIPACQTGQAKIMVQVREGVDKFTLILYGEDEPQKVEIFLE